MERGCYCTCERKNHVKAESNGCRATFYFPGGGTYKGYWTNSKHDKYGVKTTKKQLTYDGNWLHGKRHGHGTMRRCLPDGRVERIYVGEWRDDMKWGEGKQFYPDGIYYGWWKKNRRHGLGVKWYKDGSIYLGEWKADHHHGIGVLFCENGNRYEGYFARGYKNGEGTFYHMNTGQIQKGMWDNDICKTSMVIDEFRHQASQPTEYPIPKSTIADPDDFIRQLFRKYYANSNRTEKSFEEMTSLNFLRKMKHYAMLEPHAIANPNIPPLNDIAFPCACRQIEKPARLQWRDE